MWFVSQLQNAFSGSEQNEQCFMDAVRGAMEEQNSTEPTKKTIGLRNSYLRSAKPVTPRSPRLTKKHHNVNNPQNFLYSTECMELPVTPPVHKRYSLVKPKTDAKKSTFVINKNELGFETTECTVPRSFNNVLSEDAVALKRERSKLCLNKSDKSNVTSKISFTHLNCLKCGDGDVGSIRSKMSQSNTSLAPGVFFVSSTACNECEISTETRELESISRPASGKKCTQCNSVSAIVPHCNKTDSEEKEENLSKEIENTPRLKSETVKPTKLPQSPSKKSDAICIYKCGKKDSPDTNMRKSLGTKKRTEDQKGNQSKMERIAENPKEKVRDRSKPRDSAKAKTRPGHLHKRSELPIHLRPLLPVHNLQAIAPKSQPVFSKIDEITASPKPFLNGKFCAEISLANEPICVSKIGCDDVCKKVDIGNGKTAIELKNMSTSMDFENLTNNPLSPITKYRYRPQIKPSGISKFTKIPISNQSYYVGYSKISTVQEKVSYITGTRPQNVSHENLMYCQGDEPKPKQSIAFDLCQKRIAKRQSIHVLAKRSNSLEPLAKEKSASDIHVPLDQPSDLVKRIEMIRRKLAEADVEDVQIEKSSFNKKVVPYYKLGESGSGTRTQGPVQDFYELREQLLSTGTLFEDPEFPADDSSLTFSRRPDRRYEWLRPGEIVDDPQLFVEGYSRFDVQQGELGDCWLLAAVANLTLYRRLFFQIVPDDQSFDDNYAGIFHFRFWQYGRWVDVVIDDRLPTYRGQLVYLHSNEENEFWSALLEKAYAKLHGSYEALKGGSTCEAMEDFTGGVTEMYEMNASPPNLFKIIMKAYERGSLMGSSLEPDPSVLEAETPEGLIRGHAYSITRVKYVDIQTPNTVGKIPLLRLRNPWGNEIEWKGAWSDQSPEWRFIPDHEKENLGLTFDYDGEFWMSFKDFQKHFDRLEICNLTPDSLTDEEIAQGNKKQWEMSVFEGEWVRGVTAGGCRNYLETFWHNPQYRITLTDVDEDDDESKCTVIIALMQKNRRSKKQMGVEFLTIGFAVYYLPDPNRAPKPLDLNYFKYNASVARSPSFINLREVSCRFRLPPGTYCIIPSTFEANEEGEFLLRVFSENKNNMEEHDQTIALSIDKSAAVPSTLPVTDQAAASIQHPEESKHTDQVREHFLKLAGDDMEVDWEELKDVLDFATRTELQVNKVSVRETEAGVGSNRNTSNSLLGLICMPLCKTTPSEIVANAVPASTVRVAPSSKKRRETKKQGFSKDVVRSIVALLDEDRSGKLGFEEFKSLWALIKKSKTVFQKHDKDNNGTFNGFELRDALNSVGYILNNHILNILMHRYGNKQAEITFDDFVLCGIKLSKMIEGFQKRNTTGGTTISVSFDDWIETTLYA